MLVCLLFICMYRYVHNFNLAILNVWSVQPWDVTRKHVRSTSEKHKKMSLGNKAKWRYRKQKMNLFPSAQGKELMQNLTRQTFFFFL